MTMQRLVREHNPYLADFLQFIPSRKEAKILDIGCGLLSSTKYFINNDYDVISLDRNLDYLLEGRKETPNAILVCGDLQLLPFKRNSFNSILMIDVLEHLSLGDVEYAIKEIIEVLSCESRLFLHVPLEASIAYRLLRLFGRIWMKETDHKHNYYYNELMNLIVKFHFVREKEWIDARLKILKKKDMTAVAVTQILSFTKRESHD